MLGARNRNPGSGNACCGEKNKSMVGIQPKSLLGKQLDQSRLLTAPSWQCGVLFVPSSGVEGTHVVEQSFLGVLPKFLVQGLLENAHPGRHQQGKGEGSNACKGSTALQLQLTKVGFQAKKT